ncbi:hypothetical protein GLOIN_2v1685036 [Rhizophagus clarus]|uniref:Uncharacterized protein n=1 Tax=Rhizophagus clarus TaxID=94130 RepID=A0A8H3QKT6_9GLOM|nr:hypothetical protein GLOIN_2v1685036 [Rhizophagus clarus]
MDAEKTVLNILTGRWIDPNALIPPLSVLAIRADIHEKFIISVESAVMGGMSLFTLEKNKRSSLQNLIQMNYSIDNLTMLIGITWEQEEMKTWRNDVLMKFLHHSNLAPSKHRLDTDEFVYNLGMAFVRLLQFEGRFAV